MQPVEILAVGLAGELVGRRDAGAEEFARVQRELIAEFRFGVRERTLAIEPRAAAVSAGKLPVDEDRDAESLPDGDSSSAGIIVSTASGNERVFRRRQRKQGFVGGRRCWCRSGSGCSNGLSLLRFR